MVDVTQQLWKYCEHLRHDGMSYGNYIEQLTYLLFLKIADEKNITVPNNDLFSWKLLKPLSGNQLKERYEDALQSFRRLDQKKFPKDLDKEQIRLFTGIFSNANSLFRKAKNLKEIIMMMDKITWSEIESDVKGEAYEGLLEKYASNEKGAGQYFTPRPLIESMVYLSLTYVPENLDDFRIHDPAAGTCGFLVGASKHLIQMGIAGEMNLDRKKLIQIQKKIFSGVELVPDTRRLGLMNLYLQDIYGNLTLGDSLSIKTENHYDVILTNPPFGIRGGVVPARDDFVEETSNKQFNFLQHVISILKPGGSAAMVMPDNVLFEAGSGRKIRKHWLNICNVHTILRLPNGSFTPYANAKANVVFFTKGFPGRKNQSNEIWIYDLRTNVQNIKKSNPITRKLLDHFETSYLQKTRKENQRFRKFTIREIEDRKYNLDIVWIEDKSFEDFVNLPDPEEIASLITENLHSTLDDFSTILEELQSNKAENERISRDE